MKAAPGMRGIVLALAVLSVGACKGKVSQPQCDALIDHFAEVVVKEHFPDAGATTIEAERARERTEAKGDVLHNCTSEVQPSEHACAMKATTSEGVIKCLE